VAHYGMKSILQLSPSGKLLRTQEVDFPLTSNLFFADKNTLIVTGGFGEPGPGGVIKILL
ncbi:MAG: SMP-30/gluconolactonase/LRE family protein, partial [Ginsengibacter sp.]